MRRHRAGRDGIAVIAAACLALAEFGFGSRAARAQAPAPVQLQYKFPEGKTLRYRTSSNPFQVFALGGMEMQTRERKTVVWTEAIGKRRGDSSRPIEVKIESLRADLRLQGGIDLTFDSTQPAPKVDDPDLAPLIELYKLESQVAYTVVRDGRGKVKAIEGTEKLGEKAAQLDAVWREQIRSRIEPDRLEAQFEQEHRNLPDGPVRPGESWERTEVMDLGGQALSFRKKYEYAGIEKRGARTLDKITSKVVEVKCVPDPHTQAPIQVTKSDLKIDSSEGTLLFDREEGCMVEARERTKFKGTMTFSGGGADTAGRVEVTLQSNTQLQSAAK